jgi:hypothetical protein
VIVNLKDYSYETQQIIGKEPSWVIRYGTIILWSCFILLLFLSANLHYTETVKGSQVDPSLANKLVIRIPDTNKVKEWTCTDGDTLIKNQVMAVLDNPANEQDIFLLKSIIDPVNSTKAIALDTLHLPVRLNLGELQPVYTEILHLLTIVQKQRLTGEKNNFSKLLKESLGVLSMGIRNWEQKFLLRSQGAGVVRILQNKGDVLGYILPVQKANEGMGRFSPDAHDQIKNGQDLFIISGNPKEPLIRGKVNKVYEPGADGYFYVSYILTENDERTRQPFDGIISVITRNQTILNRLIMFRQ